MFATIGIYLPTRLSPGQADLDSLQRAAEKVRHLIAAAGTSEEEIVADFKQARRTRRERKN